MNSLVKSGIIKKVNFQVKPSFQTFVIRSQNQFPMKMKNIGWIALVFILATMASCRRDRKETLSNTITVDNSTAEIFILISSKLWTMFPQMKMESEKRNWDVLIRSSLTPSVFLARC
jgi:hypothetical protein